MNAKRNARRICPTHCPPGNARTDGRTDLRTTFCNFENESHVSDRVREAAKFIVIEAAK